MKEINKKTTFTCSHIGCLFAELGASNAPHHVTQMLLRDNLQKTCSGT
jgi:hypothetical protein